MSILNRTRTSKRAAKGLAESNPGRKLLGSKFATITVWTIAALWTIPTLGIFTTSFRDKKDIVTNGWWNIFIHPHLTLAN